KPVSACLLGRRTRKLASFAGSTRLRNRRRTRVRHVQSRQASRALEARSRTGAVCATKASDSRCWQDKRPHEGICLPIRQMWGVVIATYGYRARRFSTYQPCLFFDLLGTGLGGATRYSFLDYQAVRRMVVLPGN